MRIQTVKSLTSPPVYWDIILAALAIIIAGGFLAAVLAGFLVDHFGKVVHLQ